MKFKAIFKAFLIVLGVLPFAYAGLWLVPNAMGLCRGNRARVEERWIGHFMTERERQDIAIKSWIYGRKRSELKKQNPSFGKEIPMPSVDVTPEEVMKYRIENPLCCDNIWEEEYKGDVDNSFGHKFDLLDAGIKVTPLRYRFEREFKIIGEPFVGPNGKTYIGRNEEGHAVITRDIDTLPEYVSNCGKLGGPH